MPANAIQPIRRLLIANRGEIARRIIRTAHDMGIGTVAVYANGDAGAPFVREADTAIALNGRTSAETYLDAEKVLAACQRTGADAVHPGYGFLSENTGFADAVTRAGIRWVGPSSEAIAAMGDKLSAKRIIQEAKVPTLPAIELKPGEDIEAAAEKIGYPVLVKASAGGGGRGMRVVENPEGLEEAVTGGPSRSRRRLRRRHSLSRTLGHFRPPRRNPDSWRHPRQPRASIRARVLHPAPPSEDHRGGALAGGQRRAARSHG